MLSLDNYAIITLNCSNSQGGRGNFTYLLEGQINFALKLSVGCLISQF